MELELDFVRTLERMAESDRLSDRILALEKRLPAIDVCERRLEIMQEVQNNLSLELDAVKFDHQLGSGESASSSGAICRAVAAVDDRDLAACAGVGRADLQEELRRRDAALRLEFRDALRNLHKKLMFCSESETSEDESGGGDREGATTRLEYRFASGGSCSLSGPDHSFSAVAGASSSSVSVGSPFSYSAIASGAVPKRPAASRRSTKTDRAVQTADSFDSSSQANISEDDIYKFVTSNFRDKVSAIVEKTAHGRMSNTIHHFIDIALQKMVEEAVKNNTSEKTISQFLDMMRDTLDRFIAGELKEKVAEMVRKELEEMKPKIMEELDELFREKLWCPCASDANMECCDTSSIISEGNLSKEPSGSSELSCTNVEVWNKDGQRERTLSAEAEEFKPCSRRSHSGVVAESSQDSSLWTPRLPLISYQPLPIQGPPVAFGVPPPPAPTYFATPFKTFWTMRH